MILLSVSLSHCEIMEFFALQLTEKGHIVEMGCFEGTLLWTEIHVCTYTLQKAQTHTHTHALTDFLIPPVSPAVQYRIHERVDNRQFGLPSASHCVLC